MADAALIAIDWGTTNRRAYAIAADGVLVAAERDGKGVLSMGQGDFAAEVAAIRQRLGDLPVIAGGMVGSARGWVETPYLPCPASLPAVAASLHWVEPGRLAIAPGVSCRDGTHADVMRGEEIQIFGARAAGLAPPDALLCQPGTHCKWVVAGDGQIRSFRTAMTGEMFALLRDHSLLGEMIGREQATDGPAFRQGVADAGGGRLLCDLFSVRAGDLIGVRPRKEAASYVSGLLIGSDVVGQRLDPARPVHLIANGALATLYTAAIEAQGATVVRVDSERAFLAGIAAIWSQTHAS